MARVLDFLCISILFFPTLCVDAASEHCAYRSWPDRGDEETSLLQVTTQTSVRSKLSASGETSGPFGVKAAVSKPLEAEAPQPQQWPDPWSEQADPSSSYPDDPWAGDDVPLVNQEDERLEAPTSSNPFENVRTDLAEDCPAPADQGACNKAIWLAGSLVKLTEGTKSDLVTEAGRILLVQDWFQNPAGPAGFFNFMDRDSSGALDAAELMGHGGRGLLMLIDLDHDSQASRAECQTFLRGSAVLFKKLPARNMALAKMPVPVMLELADTVTLESTVATGPASHPLKEVAAALQEHCPEAGNTQACEKAVLLAQLLVNMTAGTPPDKVVNKASRILSLWNWFEHPRGPSGFFNAVDSNHRGRISSGELMSLPGNNVGAPELVKFIDTDKDGMASRAEIQSYLKGCVMLIHKLPMLDLAAAREPVPDMFNLADSVIKSAVMQSSPLAWCISMSSAGFMLLVIFFIHCWPCRSRNKEKEQQLLEEQALEEEEQRFRDEAGCTATLEPESEDAL